MVNSSRAPGCLVSASGNSLVGGVRKHKKKKGGPPRRKPTRNAHTSLKLSNRLRSPRIFVSLFFFSFPSQLFVASCSQNDSNQPSFGNQSTAAMRHLRHALLEVSRLGKVSLLSALLLSAGG